MNLSSLGEMEDKTRILMLFHRSRRQQNLQRPGFADDVTCQEEENVYIWKWISNNRSGQEERRVCDILAEKQHKIRE